MKAFCIAVALSSFALMGQAWADVRTLHPVQHINAPDGYTHFGQDVAIDDGQMIVLADNMGGKAALLYRRDSSTKQYVFERVLQSISTSVGSVDVAMKNGLAAVQFGNQEWIYEFNGSTYVLATTAQPLSHPGGVAISGNSILIGGNGCEYDGVIYQKGSNGTWDITGRLDDHMGSCLPAGHAVELNNDYAILHGRNSPSTATAFHRNGTEFEWVPAGTLNRAAGPFALQNSTAVAPGNYVFLRSGSTWPQVGRATADDYFNTLGDGGVEVVYRDGTLLATETVVTPEPYAYLETTPGQFEHVAVLQPTNLDYTWSQDESKNTVVAGTENFDTPGTGVDVFQLPTPLAAPSPIVNDFETLDISGFSFAGNSPGSWSLRKRGTNDVLRQAGNSGTPIAAVNGSDWTGYRRIEADITPTYVGSITWVGLIVRFIDVNHYYYARISGANEMGIYRHRDGVETVMRQIRFTPTPTLHVSFSDDGVVQVLSVNNQSISTPASPSAGNGPAALITDEAAADFDNVHVAATEPFTLLEKDYSRTGPINGQDFKIKGGNWQVLPDQGSNDSGLAQTNPNVGTALATIGVPVENQEIDSDVRLDSFNSADTGAWYGFVARYQDAQNYYSVAVRSNGQVQIRKTVNGVVTILGSGSFTPQAGVYYRLRFRLVHDELKLFVAGVLVADARDGMFVTGQYGLVTHSARAKWQTVLVRQP